MPTIEIFDPPMCCASGVCGPDPDAQLAHFSADLDWLSRQGVEVRRYNLAQEPTAFAQNADVKRLLEETDGDGLPVILVDGKVMGHGAYPHRDELVRWTGIAASDQTGEAAEDLKPGLLTPAVTELIAIGAAIASNCESCLKYHYAQALKLGVPKEEMIEAVNVALRVKEAPAGAMVRLAQKLLLPDGASASSRGCCGGDGEKGCC